MPGGAEGNRTPDLLNAIKKLYENSDHSPPSTIVSGCLQNLFVYLEFL